MGLEINKIIVAILVTVLVVLGIGKISDIIFETEKNVVAYKVEVKNKISTGSTQAESIDISALLALGNVDRGKKVFKKCAACHSIKKGGTNKIGPALWSVMSRKPGDIVDKNGNRKYQKIGCRMLHDFAVEACG